MGLTDSVVFVRDPLAPDVQDGAELLDRAPLISNFADRLTGPQGQTFIHDSKTASSWAALWSALPDDRTPTTLTAAFRERLGVQLVLAEPRTTRKEQWGAISEEAAWYLVSALGARSGGRAGGDGQTRVTVACGSALRKVIQDIRDPVAFDLVDRVADHYRRQDRRELECMQAFPGHQRAIHLITRRRRLNLEARGTNPSTLWSIGAVTVAPMVGMFGSTRRSVEANHNSALLAAAIDGEALQLAASAYIFSGAPEIPAAIVRHWERTDFLLMACDDLVDHWFGEAGRVNLPEGMHADLTEHGAVGEIAGLYLAPTAGRSLRPSTFARA